MRINQQSIKKTWLLNLTAIPLYFVFHFITESISPDAHL